MADIRKTTELLPGEKITSTDWDIMEAKVESSTEGHTHTGTGSEGKKISFDDLNDTPLYVSEYTNQLFVDINGDDTTGDGSIESPYKTLQKAHDVANVGNTICIGAGNFFGNLSITKNDLFFKGTGRPKSIVYGLVDVAIGTEGIDFRDLSVIVLGLSGIVNALTVNSGVDIFAETCKFQTNTDIDSRCIKVDGGIAVLFECNTEESPTNPIVIDTINGGELGAKECVLQAVFIDASSTFGYMGTYWDRANSNILGTEDKYDTLKNILSVTDEDVEITDSTKGWVLKSPNGNRRRVTLNNDGTLSTSDPL